MKWTYKAVEREKAAVKAELILIEKSGGKGELLRYLQSQINTDIVEAGPTERLRLFVLMVSTLVFQIRYRALPVKQVAKISEAAFIILDLQGISPNRSNLGFMHGEIHAALSQLSRQRGNHTESAWHQHLSSQSSPIKKREDPGFIFLTEGNRALRLGFAGMALKKYETALLLQISNHRRDQINLQIIKTLRLSGNPKKALEHAVLYQPAAGELLQEWQWELACCEVQENSGDIRPLIRNTKPKSSHCLPIYQLEAHCWWRASASVVTERKLPSVATIERKTGRRKIRYLLRWVEMLSQLYSEDSSFDMKARALGHTLENGALLEGIEYELLMWIGAGRWLARNNNYDLAAFCINHYRCLSLNLSGGRAQDCLNLAADLLEKSWFKCRHGL